MTRNIIKGKRSQFGLPILVSFFIVSAIDLLIMFIYSLRIFGTVSTSWLLFLILVLSAFSSYALFRTPRIVLGWGLGALLLVMYVLSTTPTPSAVLHVQPATTASLTTAFSTAIVFQTKTVEENTQTTSRVITVANTTITATSVGGSNPKLLTSLTTTSVTTTQSISSWSSICKPYTYCVAVNTILLPYPPEMPLTALTPSPLQLVVYVPHSVLVTPWGAVDFGFQIAPTGALGNYESFPTDSGGQINVGVKTIKVYPGLQEYPANIKGQYFFCTDCGMFQLPSSWVQVEKTSAEFQVFRGGRVQFIDEVKVYDVPVYTLDDLATQSCQVCRGLTQPAYVVVENPNIPTGAEIIRNPLLPRAIYDYLGGTP